MEGKKDRVTYTVTIKGDDGSEEVFTTQNFIVCSIGMEENARINSHRVVQAKPFELFNLYIGIMDNKLGLEKMDKILPILYEFGIKKEFIKLEDDALDGGVV